MSEILTQQGRWFLLCFCIGVAIALSYDLVRILRRIVSHCHVAIAVEDVSFWLIWTFFALKFIHNYGDGCLHGYMFLGLIAGIVLWENTISSVLMKIGNYMLCLTKKQTKKERKC